MTHEARWRKSMEKRTKKSGREMALNLLSSSKVLKVSAESEWDAHSHFYSDSTIKNVDTYSIGKTVVLSTMPKSQQSHWHRSGEYSGCSILET
jgi:hypothetical protein